MATSLMESVRGGGCGEGGGQKGETGGHGAAARADKRYLYVAKGVTSRAGQVSMRLCNVTWLRHGCGKVAAAQMPTADGWQEQAIIQKSQSYPLPGAANKPYDYMHLYALSEAS